MQFLHETEWSADTWHARPKVGAKTESLQHGRSAFPSTFNLPCLSVKASWKAFLILCFCTFENWKHADRPFSFFFYFQATMAFGQGFFFCFYFIYFEITFPGSRHCPPSTSCIFTSFFKLKACSLDVKLFVALSRFHVQGRDLWVKVTLCPPFFRENTRFEHCWLLMEVLFWVVKIAGSISRGKLKYLYPLHFTFYQK